MNNIIHYFVKKSSEKRKFKRYFSNQIVLFRKRKAQTEPLCSPAVINDTGCGILSHAMTVESDGNLNAGAADDVLLFFIFEEFQHVRMLSILVDRIVADVHLPEDSPLAHLHKIRIRIFPARLDKTEHIGMRNTKLAATALGKRKKIAVRAGGIGCIERFHQRVVKVGNVDTVGQRMSAVPCQRTKLNSAQYTDLVAVFFLDEIDVIEITAQRTVKVGLHIHIDR